MQVFVRDNNIDVAVKVDFDVSVRVTSQTFEPLSPRPFLWPLGPSHARFDILPRLGYSSGANQTDESARIGQKPSIGHSARVPSV